MKLKLVLFVVLCSLISTCTDSRVVGYVAGLDSVSQDVSKNPDTKDAVSLKDLLVKEDVSYPIIPPGVPLDLHSNAIDVADTADLPESQDVLFETEAVDTKEMDVLNDLLIWSDVLSETETVNAKDIDVLNDLPIGQDVFSSPQDIAFDEAGDAAIDSPNLSDLLSDFGKAEETKDVKNDAVLSPSSCLNDYGTVSCEDYQIVYQGVEYEENEAVEVQEDGKLVPVVKQLAGGQYEVYFVFVDISESVVQELSKQASAEAMIKKWQYEAENPAGNGPPDVPLFFSKVGDVYNKDCIGVKNDALVKVEGVALTSENTKNRTVVVTGKKDAFATAWHGLLRAKAALPDVNWSTIFGLDKVINWGPFAEGNLGIKTVKWSDYQKDYQIRLFGAIIRALKLSAPTAAATLIFWGPDILTAVSEDAQAFATANLIDWYEWQWPLMTDTIGVALNVVSFVPTIASCLPDLADAAVIGFVDWPITSLKEMYIFAYNDFDNDYLQFTKQIFENTVDAGTDLLGDAISCACDAIVVGAPCAIAIEFVMTVQTATSLVLDIIDGSIIGGIDSTFNGPYCKFNLPFDKFECCEGQGEPCSVGIGECKDYGIYKCWKPNDPCVCAYADIDTLIEVFPNQPTPEKCDCKDNDCDGVTDNGNLCGVNQECKNCACQCKAGFSNCNGTCVDLLNDKNNCNGCGNVCNLANAESKCVNGQCVISQCLGSFKDKDGKPTNGCECEIKNESCNNVDDDCDSETDENLTQACPNICGNGIEYCVAGDWENCNAPQPQSESCNNIDDNCNGNTDEGLTQPCPSVCGNGKEYCEKGLWVNCDAPKPKIETCNNIDDNCDGGTDENLTQECPNICGNGIEKCEKGEWVNCDAPQSKVESCNGLDDDCDLQIDDGNLCSEGKVCSGGSCVSSCKLNETYCSGLGCKDLLNDSLNCNSCGNICNIPNANAICQAGQCGFNTCNPNYYDINKKLQDGCEYNCVFKSAQESCNNIDDNCDGTTDEGVKDACNGCSGMNYKVGDSCGCGTWQCSGTNFVCVGDQTNVCGGCGNLLPDTAIKDQSCGTCKKWTCDLTDLDMNTLICVGPEVNLCNGCAVLNHNPSEVCGSCGKYVCDGTENIKCNDAPCVTYYADQDKDGFGTSQNMCLCATSAPFTATKTGDCDDGNPNTFPQAQETKCDGVNEDCDGTTDEDAGLCLATENCTGGKCVLKCQCSSGECCDLTTCMYKPAGTSCGNTVTKYICNYPEQCGNTVNKKTITKQCDGASAVCNSDTSDWEYSHKCKYNETCEIFDQEVDFPIYCKKLDLYPKSIFPIGGELVLYLDDLIFQWSWYGESGCPGTAVIYVYPLWVDPYADFGAWDGMGYMSSTIVTNGVSEIKATDMVWTGEKCGAKKWVVVYVPEGAGEDYISDIENYTLSWLSCW